MKTDMEKIINERPTPIIFTGTDLHLANFVSLEVALKLKSNSYDGTCIAYIDESSNLSRGIIRFKICSNLSLDSFCTALPTKIEAISWLYNEAAKWGIQMNSVEISIFDNDIILMDDDTEYIVGDDVYMYLINKIFN